MKTKTLVLVGIAVCAILLASPVLASAGYSKIYGNANEDDVLDMRDVTYIKLVIFGKKPVTDFADANYDGKISMLDIGQTKLIILGKEKQLTLVDMADRAVTVPRPIERVVANEIDVIRTFVALGAADKLVGVHSSVSKHADRGEAYVVAYPKLAELPIVGGFYDVNIELMVSLKPDVVFTTTYSSSAGAIQEKTGIPEVSASPGFTIEQLYKSLELIGKVSEKEERGEELISFVEKTIEKIEEATSEIPEEEKSKVYFATRGADPTAWGGGVTRTTSRYYPIDIAGGINVANECVGDAVDVSKEQIIAWNPDIIIVAHSYGKPLDEVNDVEMILSDQDLQTVDAVKNHRVYYGMYPYASGRPQPRNLAHAIYLAKLSHPEKFSDWDVEEEGNVIFKAFYGVDGLFSEYADSEGWLREWLDTQQ